jgi:hypothetical protein
VDRHVSRGAEIEVRGADISARDNVSLGMAASNIQAVLSDLRDRNLIDNAEYLRMVYRFCGEYIDIPEMMNRAKEEGPQVVNVLLPQSGLVPDPGGGTAWPESASGMPSTARAKPPAVAPNQDDVRKRYKPAGKNDLIDPETGEEKPPSGEDVI